MAAKHHRRTALTEPPAKLLGQQAIEGRHASADAVARPRFRIEGEEAGIRPASEDGRTHG